MQDATPFMILVCVFDSFVVTLKISSSPMGSLDFFNVTTQEPNTQTSIIKVVASCYSIMMCI